MVIKAAQMGIPFLVSRSGLTQMGHEIAQQVGITMIGRATNKHYLLFTGAAALPAMSEPTAATGRCHCGGVRFVARFPSRFVAHCHCESCRRAHGAAFVTWAGFPPRRCGHAGRRRAGRARIVAGTRAVVLQRVRHQAFLRVGTLARRDARRARRVRRAARSRTGVAMRSTPST